MDTELEREEARKREEQRLLAIDEIGLHLEKLKNDAVRWRAQFEIEWSHDYAQYNGGSKALSPSKREGAPTAEYPEPEYRQTSDNITRSKVIITAARLGDMLFPTNEANWALDITPKPDIPDNHPEIPPPPPSLAQDPQTGEQVEQPGQHTPETLLEGKRFVARKAMRSMQDTIRDQFGESHYDEQGRATIFDACLYGSGVMFGPSLKVKRRHTYGGRQTHQPMMMESGKPTVEHVDLWSFFPQPSRCIEECEHAFRLHILPRRSLRQLAKQPGFDSRQIARLLGQEPSHGELVTATLERGAIRPDAHVVLSDRYSVWQYRGPMPKDAFRAFVTGLVMNNELDIDSAESLIRELEADQLTEIDCEVWVSQGIVIKMALSTLPPGELGYYVFNYEKNPQSLFGRGVAYLCRDDQHAANQLWHAIMLNSMMSAGPQIGVRKGSLVAQGGRAATLTADKPRVWALTDEITDIKQAMSVFVIPNVTKDIVAVYDRAKANADEHTMTPLIAQGEPTNAVPTSSGMAMLMNAANVVMRRLAKAYDDDITVPLVTAFYDWNMANNPDDSIRGDYCVVPKGASHLLIKDVMTQHLQFATQLFSTNPVLAPYMKAGVFATKNIEMLDLSPNELLYTDEQVQQNAAKAGEQPDPEVMKAQAAMAAAQAAQARAEAEARTAEARLRLEELQANLTHEARIKDIETRERIQMMQVQVSQNQLFHKMAELQKDERIEMQRIIADLTKDGAKVDLKQFEVESRAAIEAERIASQEYLQDQEIKAEKSAPKVKVQ